MPFFVYPAVISKDPESDYGVHFPDLPGCVSAGLSQTEAAINAEEALTGHLEVMIEGNESLPNPSRLEDIEFLPDEGDIGRLLVTVYVGARAKAPAA